MNAAKTTATWRGLEPTERQVRALRALGVEPMPATRGQASDAIVAARVGGRR